MGQTPDELKAEIDRTRGELATDVDQLADKVTPSKVVHRKVDDVKSQISGGLAGIKEKVMGTSQSTADVLARTADRAGTSTTDAASQVGSSVQDTAKAAGAKASETVSQVSSAARAVPGKVRSQAQGSPLAVGLIGLGLGMVLASLLPETERERRAGGLIKEKASPLLDAAKEQAKEVAAELRTTLEPGITEAVDAVKSSATDAATATKEQVQDAGADLKSSAQDSVADLRQGSSSPGDGAGARWDR